MALVDVKPIGLCVDGLGVLETFQYLDHALAALRRAATDNQYSVPSLYVKDFETGKITRATKE